jgi:hypothetical protein
MVSDGDDSQSGHYDEDGDVMLRDIHASSLYNDKDPNGYDPRSCFTSNALSA